MTTAPGWQDQNCYGSYGQLMNCF